MGVIPAARLYHTKYRELNSQPPPLPPAPTYLSVLFHYTNETHNRVLRSTHDNLLYVPKPSIELFQNSFCYSGSKIWNAMPDSIKHISSVQQFKYKYLEWNYDTFLSVMLDVFMNDDMSCSICKHCACMYIFDESTSGTIGLIQLSNSL